jgi:hypothetical protein
LALAGREPAEEAGQDTAEQTATRGIVRLHDAFSFCG